MNQQSSVGFGVDSTQLSAYAQYGNSRLGNVTLIVENTGDYNLHLQLKTYNGTTSPSGWAPFGTAVDIVARGQKTIECSGILATKLGFFGSGWNPAVGASAAKSTTANISLAIRNPADLRGAQIDMVVVGRKGFGYNDGMNRGTLTKAWGSAPTTSGPGTDISQG